MLPTIAEVLELEPVAAGQPVVVTRREELHRRVRWVHVAPPSGGRRLLLGGELLLATGVGWPTGSTPLRDYVLDLAAAGVAGLVLELGNRYETPPPTVVDACQESGLPLVVLHREVRFVAITEAVHSMIIDNQTGALRERDRVHGVFAELNRRGCSTEFLLDQAARMLRRQVVLEDLNHRAVAWSASVRGSSALTAWAARSRRAAHHAHARPAPYEGTTHWAEGGWLRTPVEAQGQRWGTLVALDCSDVPPAGEVVLENAALSLSLGRLAGRRADEWSSLGQRHLLESLVSGSYVTLEELWTAFEATGFRVADRDLLAVARRGEHGMVATHLQQVRGRAVALDVDVVCAPWADEPQSTALFLLSFKPGRPAGDEEIITLLEGTGPDSTRLPSVIAVGAEASSFRGLLASTEEAVALLQATPTRAARGTVVHRSRTAALDMLLNRKRSDPMVQTFVERVLGPLLAYDLEHHGDLVEVARACVQHPTNRKRAATACHLSRSVFYQRLQVIESLLDADLDDGHTLAALHVAIVAYGQRSTAG